MNVNVITRALGFPTHNSSTYPDHDPLAPSPSFLQAYVNFVNGPIGDPNNPTQPLFDLWWAYVGYVNQVLGPVIPLVPPVTVGPGVLNPQPPTIALNPADDSGSSNGDWVTQNTHPRFNVSYTGTDTLTFLPALYANGQSGPNATLYMNGHIYSAETLPDGTYTVTGTITDFYGNTSALGTAPKKLIVDTTPPTGSFTIAGTVIGGQLGTNNRTIQLTLNFADASGLWSYQISTDGGHTYGTVQSYATHATVTVPVDGLYTIDVEVLDNAGNSYVAPAKTVRVDTAGPTLTVTLAPPTNGIYYDVGLKVPITIVATDPSTVASTTMTLDSAPFTGTQIDDDTLAPGQHTLTVTVKDGVGNSTTQSINFVIHSTISGLINAVIDGYNRGYITAGEKTTLLGILNSSGSPGAKAGAVWWEVGLHGSGSITTGYAALLQAWSLDESSRGT
jgi:hypothetical protein